MGNVNKLNDAHPIRCWHRYTFTAALAMSLYAANGTAQALRVRPGVTRARWGTTPAGDTVWQYTLVNARGTAVRAITLGAIITNILVRDRDGKLDDVVLGMPDVEGYLTKSPYFGAVAGRYANRIARGRFTLDGTTYTLATNNGPNHLHGGLVGFDKRIWAGRAVQRVQTDSGVGVAFSLTSADGDQGYPGELRVTARYLLTDDDRIIIDYRAVTSKPTVVNLTQHSYFNLAGAKRGDILANVLTVDADRYVPVDATLIPTGELAPVEGTPFDFRTPMAVGARIDANDEQLRRAGGYDHSFVIRRSRPGLAHAAQVFEPLTGRTLDVWTTEPAVQVYTGNFLDGTVAGKGGRRYAHRGAICLETTHFPDTPNHPSFPSATLRPGEVFTSRTIYGFGVR
jgi:aldose 1-epimerase